MRQIDQEPEAGHAGYSSPTLKPILQSLAAVFVLASCYYAMVLTNWATLQSSDGINNPRGGDTSYWLQASAQWAVLLMYLWSLVAPRLFPDRDFSSVK